MRCPVLVLAPALCGLHLMLITPSLKSILTVGVGCFERIMETHKISRRHYESRIPSHWLRCDKTKD